MSSIILFWIPPTIEITLFRIISQIWKMKKKMIWKFNKLKSIWKIHLLGLWYKLQQGVRNVIMDNVLIWKHFWDLWMFKNIDHGNVQYVPKSVKNLELILNNFRF